MKKKHYLPTILICLTLIISTYYVFFRENEIEVQLDKSKYIFNQKLRNIELDRFPLRIQMDFDRLLKDTRSTQLSKVWSADLGFDLTLPPFFDLKNIYLVSFDKIAVYEKNTMTNIWLKQIDNNIESFTLIDGNNLMAIDNNGNVFIFNRNTGDMNWSHSFDETYVSNNSYLAKPFQISNNEDKRFLTSVIILPMNKNLMVLDALNREVLFTLSFDDFIHFLSDYDQIENAIYVVFENRLAKILLEKK